MTASIVPSITDEQLAELERDAEQGMAPASVSVFRALIARLRAAEKDAARYRWLRERAGVFPEDCKTIWVLMDGCSMTDLERQETDQAIDTAMEQQP